MKKLILKKDVVARINHGEMNQLKGGCDQYGFCDQYTIAHPDATCGHTCNADPSCPGANTCVESCMGTCGITCDICGMSHMNSMCDTCYVRCTIPTY